MCALSQKERLNHIRENKGNTIMEKQQSCEGKECIIHLYNKIGEKSET